MPYRLSEAVARRLAIEVSHVQREVMAEFAHLPATEATLGRRRWLASLMKELDRVGGFAGLEPSALAKRLAAELPTEEVYAAAAKDAAAALRLTVPRIPVRAVEFLAENGLTHMEKLARDLRSDLASQVRMGILRQESAAEIAKRLEAVKTSRGKGRAPARLSRGVFPKVKDRARLIAQDQLSHAHIQGRGLVYRDYEVELILIVGKETACEICSPWLGKTVTTDYFLSNYPRHPRCMCDGEPAARKGRELVKDAWERFKDEG